MVDCVRRSKVDIKLINFCGQFQQLAALIARDESRSLLAAHLSHDLRLTVMIQLLSLRQLLFRCVVGLSMPL